MFHCLSYFYDRQNRKWPVDLLCWFCLALLQVHSLQSNAASRYSRGVFDCILHNVPGCEAERVELAVRVAQETSGRFLVDDARVTSLPLAHHVDGVGVAREAEGVPAERGAEVNSDDDKMACKKKTNGWIAKYSVGVPLGEESDLKWSARIRKCKKVSFQVHLDQPHAERGNICGGDWVRISPGGRAGSDPVPESTELRSLLSATSKPSCCTAPGDARTAPVKLRPASRWGLLCSSDDDDVSCI